MASVEVLAPVAPPTTLQEVSLVVSTEVTKETPKPRKAWLAGIAFVFVCIATLTFASVFNAVHEPRSQEPPIFTFEWLLARLLNDVHELKPQEHTPVRYSIGADDSGVGVDPGPPGDAGSVGPPGPKADVPARDVDIRVGPWSPPFPYIGQPKSITYPKDQPWHMHSPKPGSTCTFQPDFNFIRPSGDDRVWGFASTPCCAFCGLSGPYYMDKARYECLKACLTEHSNVFLLDQCMLECPVDPQGVRDP